MTAGQMKSVYSRLTDVGLTKHYVKKVALPEWWDDALAENPAGYAQCLMIISRFLGIDLKSLRDTNGPLRLLKFGECKFKKRKDTTEEELLLSSVIATRAAQIAGAALTVNYQQIPNALEIRSAILDNKKWVGFDELIDYCWLRGIPVLHINSFPPKSKHPDGFTLRLNGRPVIVLCRNEKQPSWLLFILAHELGHIGCGHIDENGALLDEQLGGNEQGPGEEQDEEEEEADRFAMEILTGKPTTTIRSPGRWPNAKALAKQALSFGGRNCVDPGHVVLNVAHGIGPNFFGVARAALKELYPCADAMKIVSDKLSANLEWELIPEDSSEFLMRITGQSSGCDE